MRIRITLRSVTLVLPFVLAVAFAWTATALAPAQNAQEQQAPGMAVPPQQAPAMAAPAQGMEAGQPPAVSAPGQYPGAEAAIAAGRQRFLRGCDDCHGDDAAGDGPEHTQFIPHPANLTLVRDTPAMFASIVRNGVPNTAMGGNHDIDDATMRGMYEWIRTRPMDTTNQWERPWDAEIQPIAAETGPNLYVTMCRGCHGDKATGDGMWARNDNHIWPKPANFRARSSDLGRLYHIISNGREGTMMPPMSPRIDARARLSLARYVYALYAPQTVAEIPTGPIERYTNPFTISDQAVIRAGEDSFDLYCAFCHNGKGKGTFLAPRLIDRSWYFGGGTDNAVFTVVTNGVPGELMPTHRSFDPKARWEVITYIRQHGGLPEPVTQLPVTDER